MSVPVDHRQFITGFDVAGFIEAINAEAQVNHEKHWATICEYDELSREGGEMAVSHEHMLQNVIEKLIRRIKRNDDFQDVMPLLHSILSDVKQRARQWDTPQPKKEV